LLSRSKVGELVKDTDDTMMKNFEDMQKLGQTNVDSAMRMFGEWNKNWQAIGAEIGDYSKRSFEEGSATLEKLLASKSVEQAVEIQTSYAKRAYEEYMQQMTKLGGMYAKIAKEAYKPIGSSSYSGL
jgi:tRNA splicing ligase